MFCLQSRWKYENGGLCYYGLRNHPYTFKNTVRLTRAQQKAVEQLPCDLTESQIKTLGKLIGRQIVEQSELRKIPESLSEAKFCKNCVANDFIIPGLEFDENGLCPMCQTKSQTEGLKTVVPLMSDIPTSKKSRFDVAVFYTGGKDSTYLLYYLAKIKGLRVLALTWEIPFMSDCAKQSIDGAKKAFSSVEFISRKVSDDDLRRIYRKLYSLNSNTCACPSLAYALFYPELVANKVPYFVVGNEPVQMLGLYYNGMAPKIAYKFADNKFLNFFVNAYRVLTLRPPFKRGQFQTLATMKQLAYGDNPLKRLFGYRNLLVENVVSSMHTVKSIVAPLKRAIRTSSITGNIPAFVHIDFNDACNGVYDWKDIKSTLVNECGWVAPDEDFKGLHTSCKIEKCKENSQFRAFYQMKSTMIPFSALEISLASRDKNLSREDAKKELALSLGFCTDEIAECEIMKEYLK